MTAVSFDLFGTLVRVDRPSDPAAAIARELRERGVRVPDSWQRAFYKPHVNAPEGAEVPLPAHVSATLNAGGVTVSGNAARRAVVAAFDPEVETIPGASGAVTAAHEYGPVGVLSNCAVPELVGRTLVRSDLSRDDFDAVVTSVACGWRKPQPQAFQSIARALGVPVGELIHIGDTPETDGGIADIGGRFLDVGDVSLADVPNWLKTHGEGDA